MIQQSIRNILRNSLVFWNELAFNEKQYLVENSVIRRYASGALINNCTSTKSNGVQIVKNGKARAFISSPEGRQLTLQRIGDNELFTIGVSCVFDDAIFDVSLETETPCEMIFIPRNVFRRLLNDNPVAKDEAHRLVIARFANTMRVLEAITFTSTKSRLANALIEQSISTGSRVFNATHERIAADIGSSREVVTKLLKKFQLSGFLTLLRGRVMIDDMQALIDIRGEYLEYIGNLLYPKRSAHSSSTSI